MKRIFFLTTFLFSTQLAVLQAQDAREVSYIQKHALLAVQEMELFKIPASITLAQGILETGGGQSRLAEQANNHFGIKCKAEWTGETITHDDDAVGECFRKYKNVKESYRDHSKFLAERPYYRKLFDLPVTDYKGWAHGLKKAGYATNPRYAYILISKIENNRLQEFDVIKSDSVYDKLVTLYGPVDRSIVDPEYKEVIIAGNQPSKTEVAKPETKTMEVPKREISPRARVKRHPVGREYIEVYPGETLGAISKLYDVGVEKLMDYNELKRAEDLKADQFLFFARKKNSGAKKFYKVVKGDNLYLISQKNGIKMDQLLRRNRIDENYKPAVGETMYLRGRKPKK